MLNSASKCEQKRVPCAFGKYLHIYTTENSISLECKTVSELRKRDGVFVKNEGKFAATKKKLVPEGRKCFE